MGGLMEEKQEVITQTEIEKKIVYCLSKECPFGLKEISTPCNLCHHKKEEIIRSSIKPLLMKVTFESEFYCYKHEKLEGYQECIFGKKSLDEGCQHCGRFTRKKIINSKTEAL